MNDFFFSENGPDDGQAPLGYPQKQYEDGGPPLFISRSEDIRAGDRKFGYVIPMQSKSEETFSCHVATCLIIMVI